MDERKVKIARLKWEYLSRTWQTADVIFIKYQGNYYRWTSYSGKRLNHKKGHKFCVRRWIARNDVSFHASSYRSLLEEAMFKTDIEKVRVNDLDILFQHFQRYIEGCGRKFEIKYLEDFDIIF